MRFELIGGNHEEGGKSYKKGDIIDSPNNLISMFRGKFKRVEGGTSEPKRVPNIPTKNSSPPKGSEAGTPKSVSGSIKTRLGPDVTISFLETKGTKFKIHKAAGDKYHVVDGESNIFGGDGFTRAEVLIYLNNA